MSPRRQWVSSSGSCDKVLSDLSGLDGLSVLTFAPLWPGPGPGWHPPHRPETRRVRGLSVQQVSVTSNTCLVLSYYLPKHPLTISRQHSSPRHHICSFLVCPGPSQRGCGHQPRQVRDLVTSVLLFLINIPCTSISRMLQCYKRNVPAQHALLMYMQPIIVVMSFRFACHFDFSFSELCFDWKYLMGRIWSHYKTLKHLPTTLILNFWLVYVSDEAFHGEAGGSKENVLMG